MYVFKTFSIKISKQLQVNINDKLLKITEKEIYSEYRNVGYRTLIFYPNAKFMQYMYVFDVKQYRYHSHINVIFGVGIIKLYMSK